MDALALEFMKIAADSGDPECCLELGKLYYRGDTINIDWNRARHYLERSEPDAEGLMMLGMICRAGVGMKTDISKVFRLFKRSAELGNAEALYHLGMMYMNGIFVRRNEAEGYRLINEAKKKGFMPCDVTL